LSILDDYLQSLFELQLLENDLKSVGATFPLAPEYAYAFVQINGSPELALNLDDSGDNIQVVQCRPRRFLPTVLQPKSYETNRHHIRPPRHPRPNHLPIITTGQVQVT